MFFKRQPFSACIHLCDEPAFFAPAHISAQSQTWHFDWAKRPAEGSSVSAPKLDLSSAETVTLEINNVNLIQYRYHMSCTGTAANSALSQIGDLFTGGALESADRGCKTKADGIKKDVADFKEPPKGESGKTPSNPVVQARVHLAELLAAIEDTQNNECALNEPVKKELGDLAAELRVLRQVSNSITFTQSIAPDYEYTCTVTEQTQSGSLTEKGSLQIAINPGSSIATLSVGALASTVPTRSFEVVAAPNTDNTGATNVLGVQGDSISGNIATLINFRLPVNRFNRDKWGIDLSMGPVFRVGSSGNASSIGFFGGVSLRLYKYFFITPGLHLGPVADYPIGFSRPGQAVPPNFGTPAAVNRTTARFGVAITVQAKNFGKLSGSRVTSLPVPTTPPSAGTDAGDNEEEDDEQDSNDQDGNNDAQTAVPAELPLEPSGDEGELKGTLTNPSTNTGDWKIVFGDPPSGVTPVGDGHQACKLLKRGEECEITVKIADAADDLEWQYTAEHSVPPESAKLKLVLPSE